MNSGVTLPRFKSWHLPAAFWQSVPLYKVAEHSCWPSVFTGSLPNTVLRGVVHSPVISTKCLLNKNKPEARKTQCLLSPGKVSYGASTGSSETQKIVLFHSKFCVKENNYHVCVCVGGGAQSCPALCNPMNCSLSGSSVHGIFQAGILEWVAMPSSRRSSRPRDRSGVSCVSCIGRRILYHCTTWEACQITNICWIWGFLGKWCTFLYPVLWDGICKSSFPEASPSFMTISGRSRALAQNKLFSHWQSLYRT